jgi:hypothetical protein
VCLGVSKSVNGRGNLNGLDIIYTPKRIIINPIICLKNTLTGQHDTATRPITFFGIDRARGRVLHETSASLAPMATDHTSVRTYGHTVGVSSQQT